MRNFTFALSPCLFALFSLESPGSSIKAFESRCSQVLEGAATVDRQGVPAEATANDVWEILRAKRLLVDQHSIPGRENLCSFACAVNLAQGAAMLADRFKKSKGFVPTSVITIDIPEH